MLRALALVAPVLAMPASVAAFDDMDQIISIRVIDGGKARDGSHVGALHVTLAPGWKTYWRAPGDAGIPPEFSFAGSENVEAVDIAWPTPDVFDQNGMTSIGYDTELVLPLHIMPYDAGLPLHLSGEVSLGICKDVCIPGHVSFDGVLDPAADRSPTIVAALADRPYSAHEAGVTRSACRLAPGPHGMQVTATIDMPPAGGVETVVFEPSDPMIWASQAEVTRQGNRLIARADLGHPDGGFALDRSGLRITVLGRDHAVDIHGCDAG
ncbi:MAG: hypothetical protein HRU31_02215 [Rhodobacteraceae bacterium]|nr:hypothetical protein [Paracoccaceae bacterium]